MLTTVQLNIQNSLLNFHLYQGDNLWGKVLAFCTTNNLLEYSEQIFDLIFAELLNYQKNEPSRTVEKTPPRNKPHKSNEELTHFCDLRSTKRNELCQQYKTQEFTYSPKINSNTCQGKNHNPFQTRINLKQIVHKNHDERHEQREKENYSFSPIINTTYINCTASPFKERLLQKQIIHKDHKLRHSDNNQSLKQCKKKTIEKKENSFSSEECQEILCYSKNQFISVKRQLTKVTSVEQPHVIDNINKLDKLTKRLFEKIKSTKIEDCLYRICTQLYRRILSSQEFRKILKLNLVNYSVLEIKEVKVLEEIVKKYSLSLDLEISQNQFLILMIHLLYDPNDEVVHNGIEIQNLLTFNPSLTAHYQQL